MFKRRDYYVLLNEYRGEIKNMKMKCPKCGEVFEGPLDSCPKCGAKFKNSASKENVPAPVKAKESYWDGHLIQLIGWCILGSLLTIITLGIMYPWFLCRLQAWHCKHTVLDGYRLTFDGHAGQLIGNWLLWLLLTIVTLGIFSLWIPMKIEKWKTKHTHLIPDNK